MNHPPDADPAPGSGLYNPRVYAFMRWVSRLLMHGFFRTTYQGAEHIPVKGPVILASNHQSFADSSAVGIATPRMMTFLAGEWLFAKRFVGWVVRAMGCVPVDPEGGPGGLKPLLARLADGGIVTLFPEGTRTPNGRLLPARPGVGLLVLKSDAVVIPVRLDGLFRCWGRHRLYPRPGRVRVSFGPPIPTDDLRTLAAGGRQGRKDAYRLVAERIMDAIAALPGTNT